MDLVSKHDLSIKYRVASTTFEIVQSFIKTNKIHLKVMDAAENFINNLTYLYHIRSLSVRKPKEKCFTSFSFRIRDIANNYAAFSRFSVFV